MAVDHLARQAECHAQLPHLVLEQLAQRLEQAQAQRLRQATDIVVALDGGRLLALGAARFDDVGVDGALRQPLGAYTLSSLVLEHLNELAADDLALGLRVGHTSQVAHELLAGVDVDDAGMQLALEHGHHLLGLVQPQQPVVDEDAGELVADGAMDQRGRDAGIDAATETEDRFVAAHLRTDGRHRLGDVVAHDPVAAAAADVAHKAAQQRWPLHGVRHFGVELQRVEGTRLVGHAGNRAAVGAGHQLEAGRQLGDLVAVAHPDVEQAVALGRAVVLDAIEQPGVAPGTDPGEAELALLSRFDLATQLLRHGLHAVADAQHRHAGREHRCRGLVGGLLVRRHVAAGEDDALGAEAADEVVRHVAGVDLAVDLRFTHAARDQLRDLAAEVEDEDAVVRHSRCVL